MNFEPNILGIDIGSVSISLAEVSPEKEIVGTAYEFHHGHIAETLRRMLGGFDLANICAIAATASTPSILKTNRHYDNRLAVMTACRRFHGKVGAILMVGGERFGLIRFDRAGNYRSYKSNTSCAAGTGSFLDQQAGRLGLSSIEELSHLAMNNTGPAPQIATRCAVFAKTDLVHAQQEGYTLAQICDGLCRGLARNIVDTLFSGETCEGPVVFSGGVSRNASVVKHIRSMVHQDILVEESLYGAAGAGLMLLDELLLKDRITARIPADILLPVRSTKNLCHPPLTLRLSAYPEFDSVESFEYQPPEGMLRGAGAVEVDVYRPLKRRAGVEAILGLDVGSTSTKAALIDRERNVLAGFYTRTVGRPVEATKAVLAAIDHVAIMNETALRIIGAATTGSGRKFVGKLIGADLIMDEITAHARAAVAIDPAVDTIIEIGGQDSKFTTLRNGQVTFSVMNTVCAAGTGSFIEEQANRLGCPLSEYSRKTEGRSAPRASDRCTVFMERDINYYLSEGYAPEEVLASALHAIVENYLSKVAIEADIGRTIFFQGATAKNKALVAAFEQRLQKPIHVSRYCHLTGALGSAYCLVDEPIENSRFKGLDLYRQPIPITSEVCSLCANHCKITLADLGKEHVAFGFLCGRDYETGHFVDNNRSGFDLLKARKKGLHRKTAERPRHDVTIGLPAALYLQEDINFWQTFFDALSIRTLSSGNLATAVKSGKEISGAEFCAPLAAMHGHVAHLLERADYVFLPSYLEKKTEEKDRRRQYCYYSQFAPSAIASVLPEAARRKLLTPLVHYLYNSFYTKIQLYRMLTGILPGRIGFFEASAAYDAAMDMKASQERNLKEMYRRVCEDAELHVVLLGRPYTVLSPAMNKRIPNILGALGVKAFFQDMLDYSTADVQEIGELLNAVQWHYGAKILEAASVTARRRGVYPVLVTSFKCTPDAFIMDYFRKIMARHGKPYLILQLDEHDSSVGYETRIEAALRSFRNHYQTESRSNPSHPGGPLVSFGKNRLGSKTLLLPNWDPFSLRLVAAAMQKEGIDARLLEESTEEIRRSLRHNTGQCIPLNIIAQEGADYIERHRLDPAKTALWTIESYLSCNLALFPLHIKQLFQTWGNGMEKADVYAGELSFMDISVKLPVNIYFAYMFGGMIRKIGCRIRPYERFKGETDKVIEQNINLLVEAFFGRRSKESALKDVIENFQGIAQIPAPVPRPKVAVFGDLYVRDNGVMNQDLIHFIEKHGGEVVVTPYHDYLKMIYKPYVQKWFREGHYFNVISSKTLMVTMKQLEKTYIKYFQRIIPEPEIAYDTPHARILSTYRIKNENTGESIENILKIHYLMKQHPDISLFVQTSPAFCCPSLVTESMAGEIERRTGVPVVSITYDGTGGNKNEAVIPYLKYPRVRPQETKDRGVSAG